MDGGYLILIGPRLFGPFLEMCVDSAIKSEHEDSNTYYVAVIFTEGLNNGKSYNPHYESPCLVT